MTQPRELFSSPQFTRYIVAAPATPVHADVIFRKTILSLLYLDSEDTTASTWKFVSVQYEWENKVQTFFERPQE